MDTFLKKIIEEKKKEITLIDSSRFKPKVTASNFIKSLQGPGLKLIAEVKKASPSKGIIRNDFDPVSIAQSFEAHSAAAISVLTDKKFFQGDISYIEAIEKEISLPILRKDFIISEKQIGEAAHVQADAILLIKACLSTDELQTLLIKANESNLDVLIEIHSEEELNEIASIKGQFCIGINNRDLRTFETNINLSQQLISKIKDYFGKEICVVAESGYSQSSELDKLNELGFNAVLIGEGLAKNPSLIKWFNQK